MNAFAALDRVSGGAVDEFRLFLGHFNVHSAELVDYLSEHIEVNGGKVVDVNPEVVFQRVHGKLRPAVGVGGVELCHLVL